MGFDYVGFFVLHTLHAFAQICRVPHDLCIDKMIVDILCLGQTFMKHVLCL
jgi:hypothetical protein